MSDKPIRFRLAVDPGDLNADGEWHALRLGAVYDPDSGGHVCDVTDALCQGIAAAHAAFGDRMPTVLGRDHGMFRRGGDKRSRGVVQSVRHVEGEGLFIKPALNALGRSELADEAGSLWLSPTIHGPAHHPETGEKVAEAWMPECTLTPMPRQTGLRAIALSRGGDAPVQMVGLARYEGDDGSANAHRRLIEDAARAVLAERGITPEHLHCSDWSDSMCVVNAWRYGQGIADEYDKHFRFDYADGPDGTPVLTNPVEVKPVTAFEPVRTSTSLSRPADDGEANDSPVRPGEEAPMADPTMVELSRAQVDAYEADRTKLTALKAEHEAAQVELSRYRDAEVEREKALALSRAEAFADGLLIDEAERPAWIKRHMADPEDAVALSRSLRRKVDEDADAFVETLLSRGAVPADQAKGAWREAYLADPERAKRLAAGIPDGQTVQLSKPAGSTGRGNPELTDEEREAAQRETNRTKAKQLSRDEGIPYRTALARVEKESAK